MLSGFTHNQKNKTSSNSFQTEIYKYITGGEQHTKKSKRFYTIYAELCAVVSPSFLGEEAARKEIKPLRSFLSRKCTVENKSFIINQHKPGLKRHSSRAL